MIQPDDTVVIRIARSEMGQGTLTGLAQLVAEELECDWSKVTTEYPTPGQNVARNRVWQNFSTGGSRGIRESNDYVRKGGAAARMMLVQGRRRRLGRAGGRVQRRQRRGHARRLRAAARATASSRPRPRKLTPPTEITLKDPKTWKIAGKPVKRLDTAPQGRRLAGLRHGPASCPAC